MNNATKIQYSINESREYSHSRSIFSVFVDGVKVDRQWADFHEALAWCHDQPAYKS
jgi:hypothetical protein